VNFIEQLGREDFDHGGKEKISDIGDHDADGSGLLGTQFSSSFREPSLHFFVMWGGLSSSLGSLQKTVSTLSQNGMTPQDFSFCSFFSLCSGDLCTLFRERLRD
jgi:hypothetical protein